MKSSCITTARSLAARNSYGTLNHTDGGLDHLVAGGELSNVNSAHVVLTLTNLAGGDYSIKTYNHTRWGNNDGDEYFDIRLTDSFVTDGTVHDDGPGARQRTRQQAERIPVAFHVLVTELHLRRVVQRNGPRALVRPV